MLLLLTISWVNVSVSLQDRLNQLKTKNTIIKTTGTILGAGLGASLGYSNNPHFDFADTTATIGGTLGYFLSNFLTTSESEYKINLIFGPYKNKIIDVLSNSIILVTEICETHRDYSYKTEYIKIYHRFENCNLDIEHESQVPKIRKCWVSLLENTLQIIENYTKEKRSDPDIKEFYLHKLKPEFQVIQKYLKDSKVILDNNNLLDLCDSLIEETAKSRMAAKAKTQFRSTGQMMTPRERADSKPDVVDISKRRLLKRAAIGAAAATAVPILKHVASGVKKISDVNDSLQAAGNTASKAQAISDARKSVGMSAEVKDPLKRSLLTTAVTTSDGYKTIKNVGKIGKLGARTGLQVGSIFASDEVYDKNLKIIHT